MTHCACPRVLREPYQMIVSDAGSEAAGVDYIISCRKGRIMQANNIESGK